MHANTYFAIQPEGQKTATFGMTLFITKKCLNILGEKYTK